MKLKKAFIKLFEFQMKSVSSLFEGLKQLMVLPRFLRFAGLFSFFLSDDRFEFFFRSFSMAS